MIFLSNHSFQVVIIRYHFQFQLLPALLLLKSIPNSFRSAFIRREEVHQYVMDLQWSNTITSLIELLIGNNIFTMKLLLILQDSPIQKSKISKSILIFQFAWVTRKVAIFNLQQMNILVQARWLTFFV